MTSDAVRCSGADYERVIPNQQSWGSRFSLEPEMRPARTSHGVTASLASFDRTQWQGLSLLVVVR
jgi:hypothetical protein